MPEKTHPDPTVTALEARVGELEAAVGEAAGLLASVIFRPTFASKPALIAFANRDAEKARAAEAAEVERQQAERLARRERGVAK